MENIEKISTIFQAVITSLSFIIGGIWVYLRFERQQEKYPNVNFNAEIKIIGEQNEYYLVELIGIIENKGKAFHKINHFDFSLQSILKDEEIETKTLTGEVDFKNSLYQGDFISGYGGFTFVDPGTYAKYTRVVKVSNETTFLNLELRFRYSKRKNYGHTAECTIHIKK